MVPEGMRKHLPVGQRVVLSWDADNTDIDLWVTDPNGERAFYGRQLTYQGGRMSRDFTGGYGPEEFTLRKPKAGKYRVKLPHPAAAGRGDVTRVMRAWQCVPRLPSAASSCLRT